MDQLVFLRDNPVLCKRPMLYSEVENMLSVLAPTICGHRLALDNTATAPWAGNPVPTSDLSQRTTAYLAPFTSSIIGLPVVNMPGVWKAYDTTQINANNNASGILSATSPNVNAAATTQGTCTTSGSSITSLGSSSGIAIGQFVIDVSQPMFFTHNVVVMTAPSGSAININNPASVNSGVGGDTFLFFTPVNYDLFVWAPSGIPTLTFSSTSWTGTSRGTGAVPQLTIQNGVVVNKYADGNIPALAGRYVGSVTLCGAASSGGAGYMTDTQRYRYAWNAQNQVPRLLQSFNSGHQNIASTTAAVLFQSDVYWLQGMATQMMDFFLTCSGCTVNTAGKSNYMGVGFNGSAPTLNNTSPDSTTISCASGISPSNAVPAAAMIGFAPTLGANSARGWTAMASASCNADIYNACVMSSVMG